MLLPIILIIAFINSHYNSYICVPKKDDASNSIPTPQVVLDIPPEEAPWKTPKDVFAALSDHESYPNIFKFSYDSLIPIRLSGENLQLIRENLHPPERKID